MRSTSSSSWRTRLSTTPSPEVNPIERVWAQLKAQFKNEKMGLILEGRSPNYEKIIRRILQAYPAEKISSICAGTMRSQMGV